MKAQENDSMEGLVLIFDFKMRKWKEAMAEDSGV